MDRKPKRRIPIFTDEQYRKLQEYNRKLDDQIQRRRGQLGIRNEQGRPFVPADFLLLGTVGIVVGTSIFWAFK